MIGIVLCGGQSTRMSKDKGLLISQGKRWAEIIKEKFSEISIPSVLSINAAQKEKYLTHFDESDLVVDLSTITIRGPLLGLLSVHHAYPDDDLIVAACDMVNLEAKVLEKLLAEYSLSKIDAVAYTGERVEPMCAIYSANGLKKIAVHYHQNETHSHSMMHVLEKLNAKYIPIPKEWNPFFKNYNTAADLNHTN